MNSLSRTGKMLLALVLCVAAFAGDRLVLTGLIDDWRVRSQRKAELMQNLENGEFLLSRADVLKEQWDEANARALPHDKPQAENRLLESVNGWAAESKLQLSDVKPLWVEDDGLGERLEVRLNALGGIAAISRFLFEIETTPIPLKLEDLELRSRDDRGSEISMSLRVTSLTAAQSESES